MVSRGFRLNQCPVTNLYEATTFVAWTIVAVYLIVGLWARLRFLGAFASPVLFGIGVFALMPALDAPHGARPEAAGGLTRLHAALMSLFYWAFCLCPGCPFMYLTQEHKLKFHKFQSSFSFLPSLQPLRRCGG